MNTRDKSDLPWRMVLALWWFVLWFVVAFSLSGCVSQSEFYCDDYPEDRWRCDMDYRYGNDN